MHARPRQRRCERAGGGVAINRIQTGIGLCPTMIQCLRLAYHEWEKAKFAGYLQQHYKMIKTRDK